MMPYRIGSSHQSQRDWQDRRRIGIYAIYVALFVLLLTTSHARALELASDELRGRDLYRKGSATGQEMTASFGSGDPPVPASLFPCVNCHGRDGKGLREGGLAAPMVDWSHLTSPATSLLTGLRRPPYNQATLAYAIRHGVNPEQEPLHPAMPRYQLAPQQMADLLAYLKVIGTTPDSDNGISDKSIRIGAALPLSGPLQAMGKEIQRMLAACFDSLNASQGIYGRSVELVVRDSGSNAISATEAARLLVDIDQVFALVGSFEPAGSMEMSEFLRQSETPLVGPYTLSPRAAGWSNPWVFYLLPGFADQAKVLVDFATSQHGGNPVRVGAVISDTPLDLDALEGIRTQVAAQPATILEEVRYASESFDPITIATDLSTKSVDVVIFFGSSQQFLTLSQAIETLLPRAWLLTSAVVAGEQSFHLSSAMALRTALAYPGLTPVETVLSDFLEMVRKASITVNNSVYLRSSFAAAAVLAEVLKLAGRELTREGLVAALERLYDFQTGVLPPISFGPNRRIGAAGACIVLVDLARKEYRPLTGWMSPKRKL